jgi:hypothetical protein
MTMTPTFIKKWMNSSNLTDSEKADLSAYSTDEPDSSTAIEEADSPDSNSSGKSTGEGLFAWEEGAALAWEALSGELAGELARE